MDNNHSHTMILLKHGTMENAERSLIYLTNLEIWTDDEHKFMCDYMINRDFKAKGLER